jgi:MtN3 and saliva related transmembrane protein
MIQNELVIKIFRYVIYALITVAFILTPIMIVQANPSNFSQNKPFWVELIGLIAGFGTTFASLPDLFVMLKKRSRQGINPRMAAITGIFQCLWLVYGLLIQAPAVIIWNMISIVTNATTVSAYLYFAKIEKNKPK